MRYNCKYFTLTYADSGDILGVYIANILGNKNGYIMFMIMLDNVEGSRAPMLLHSLDKRVDHHDFMVFCTTLIFFVGLLISVIQLVLLSLLMCANCLK